MLGHAERGNYSEVIQKETTGQAFVVAGLKPRLFACAVAIRNGMAGATRDV